MGNLLLLSLLASAPAALPLPDHLDVPDSFSVVVCPSEAAGRKMLADYFVTQPAPRNHTIDIERFFAGLAATGCAQDRPRDGVVLIDSVIVRTDITLAEGTETYMLFRGVMGSKAVPVIGIVDEGGNNGYPRTPLAEWQQSHTKDGWLDARGGDADTQIFYRCDTSDQAVAVINSMKTTTRTSWDAYRAKLRTQVVAQHCRPARDRYYVTLLRDFAINDCGEECEIDLTAIEAIDRSGLKVGLVYDGSEM